MTRPTPWKHRLLAVAICLCAPSIAAPGDGSLTGFIFDADGEPLAGVEVLLGRGGGTVLSTASDVAGRYRFAGLDPGSYLFLATKAGYRASLVRVNTLAASTLDLTLRLLGDPVAEGGALPPPTDEGWVLRLPVRDVLREVGGEEIMTLGPRGEPRDAVADPDPEQELARSRRFNAEIRQWFSVSLGDPEPSSDLLDDGRSTEIRLGGDNGEGVLWSVAGGAVRTGASFEEAELAQMDEESHQVQVNVNLSPDRHHEVGISAWFDQSDHAYHLASAEAGEDAGRRSRAWGYNARWSGHLRGSDLDLRVGYGAANVGSLRSAELHGTVPITDERWRALGAVSFSPAAGHRLRLGMSANLYAFGSEEIRTTFDPALAGAGGPLGAGRRGWSVNLFGKESYEISEPLAIDVGFDYHHVGFDQPVSYLLPQAGVTYRPGGKQTIRATVMVKFEDGSDALPAEEPASGPSSTERFGYRLSWDREIGEDMSVSVAAAIRPYAQERLVDDEYVAYDPATHQALFVSDGNASSRELSLRLERRFSKVHGSVGVRVGRVEGSLISFLPNRIPTQALSQNVVDFVSTSLHAAIVPTGTRLRLDYHQIDNQGLLLEEGTIGPLTYRSLEMAVQQMLRSRPGSGQWRLLVAYQQIENDSEEPEAARDLARLGVPDQLRRVSGGVSVRF